jgi:membrane-associated phospholipid phosphatase
VSAGASLRSRLRAEDFLTAACAAILLSYVGGRAALSDLRIDSENFLAVCYLLAPAAVLIFLASLRYAMGEARSSAGAAVLEIGSVVRDWLPFLLFLLFYEALQSNIWFVLRPQTADAALLAWDRRLFGETPALLLERWITPARTNVLLFAYFLHIVLPPVVAFAWYRKNFRVFREFMVAMVVIGIVGSVGYVVVPAVGPGLAFAPLFRRALGGEAYRPVAALVDMARAPRDVFPSLHVGISTLVFYYGARRGRIWRWALGFGVLAIWVSTLYLRYHYLVDVFAGWAVAALSIFASRRLLRWEARFGMGNPRSAPAPAGSR